MVRVGIVGPRETGLEVPGGDWLKRKCVRLVKFLAEYDPETVIVSGGATGIDSVAEDAAKRCGLETKVFLPETGPDGKWINKGAGVARNSKIVADVDRLYAFWTGLSTGTADSIGKALKRGVLTEVIFSNGMYWRHGEAHAYGYKPWSPLDYGHYMTKMFELPALIEALQRRAEKNRRNPKNNSKEKLAYADGRTLVAFNWLAEGNLPAPGEGDLEGFWIVPSQNKKSEKVRPHQIGFDGGCNCDAVTQGHRACFAMYAVSMFLYLISPSRIDNEESPE